MSAAIPPARFARFLIVHVCGYTGYPADVAAPETERELTAAVVLFE